MFIKSLDTPRQYDVFLGSGWENWLRVTVNKNKLEVIKTNLSDIDPKTLQLIFFKIKKFIRKEKE